MPVDTTSVTVGEVVDELDERLDEIARESDTADGPEEQDEIDSQGILVDQRLAAFEQLVEEYGRDAAFEIAELTLEERRQFNDLLEAAREQAEEREGFEAGSELRDMFFVGAGVVDAPWLDGGEEMYKRVAALRSEQINVDWRVYEYLKERVTEANSKGNPERKSYAERLEARTSASTPN